MPMLTRTCVIGLVAVSVATLAQAQPRVVASIKPVHSLVAGVMAGVAEPVLLLDGGASPHAYTLRPSEARALARADVVFRVHAELERFLVKPLGSLAGGARVVTLADAPGVTLLAGGGADAGAERHRHGEREAHDPARYAQHHAEHHGPGRSPPPGHHDEGAQEHPHERDLHIWLGVDNARAMVRAIVAALAEADPPRAARYRGNGVALLARLDDLDAHLRDRLAPVADRPFLVFHDAYAYLVRGHGLRQIGAVTLSPERAPGARRIAELRERVRSLGAVCVFSEPQFEPRLVATITEGSAARTGVLDPLGARLPAGADAYFVLMEAIATALVDCLSPR